MRPDASKALARKGDLPCGIDRHRVVGCEVEVGEVHAFDHGDGYGAVRLRPPAFDLEQRDQRSDNPAADKQLAYPPWGRGRGLI